MPDEFSDKLFDKVPDAPSDKASDKASEKASGEARYLYCIVHSPSGGQENLGNIGIEKQAVYTIPYKNIAAVVHSCRPVPYDSKDPKKAEGWVLEHSYVIDQATKKYESILPFSFDVILREGDSQIEQWLGRNYNRLWEQLDALSGKAEYTIQIFYDYDFLKAKVLMANLELSDMQKRIETESKGKAYLLSKKLDQKIKRDLEAESRLLEEEFLAQIKVHADRLVVNDRPSRIPENFRDKKLMASYSCLVHKNNVDRLGEVLEGINSLQGFRVRFTGPWAPFSFVDFQELK